MEVTNVRMPVMAVSEINDRGFDVLFSKNGSKIFNEHEEIRVERKNNKFVMPVTTMMREDIPQKSAQVMALGEEETVMRGDGPETVMRELPVPSKPSEAEVRQHNLTHMPHQSWCPVCIKARGKDDRHLRSSLDSSLKE